MSAELIANIVMIVFIGVFWAWLIRDHQQWRERLDRAEKIAMKLEAEQYFSRGDLPGDSYKAARGILADLGGDEPAEVTIRRMRDDE